VPNSPAGLKKYKDLMLPAWRHTLQVDWPQRNLRPDFENSKTSAVYTSASLKLKTPEGRTHQAQYYVPSSIATNRNPRLVILATEDTPASPDSHREDLVTPLLRRGLAVLLVKPSAFEIPGDQLSIFYTAYNRTRCQERVRELVAFCSAASSTTPGLSPENTQPFQVILAGTGRAGLWAVLAAPAADAVIADCDALNADDDEQLLGPDLFCPGLRNMGSFEGAAMVAAPHSLVLHNVGRQFPYEHLRNSYKAAGASDRLKVEVTRMSAERIALLAAGL
jgi:hypothetical protein